MERPPSPPPEREAVILPFRKPEIETINGVVVNLGRMSLEEVELLEQQCAERVAEAQTDLTIVAWHLLTRRDGQVVPLKPGEDPWSRRGES